MTLKERAKDLVQSELQNGVNLRKEDGSSVGRVAMEGLQSKAYLYPLLGVYHFLSHPELFRTVQPIVYKSAIMSAIVVAVMFFFTYLPVSLASIYMERMREADVFPFSASGNFSFRFWTFR